jgi:hypothetical protein
MPLAQATLADLLAVLSDNGFDCRRGSQGHYTCTHPLLTYTVGVPSPHPAQHVKPAYVRAALRMLDDARAQQRRREEQP